MSFETKNHKTQNLVWRYSNNKRQKPFSIVVRCQLSWRRFCWRASSAAVMISSSACFRPLILGLNAGLLFQKVLKELRIKWTTAGVFEERQEILYWEHFDAENSICLHILQWWGKELKISCIVLLHSGLNHRLLSLCFTSVQLSVSALLICHLQFFGNCLRATQSLSLTFRRSLVQSGQNCHMFLSHRRRMMFESVAVLLMRSDCRCTW